MLRGARLAVKAGARGRGSGRHCRCRSGRSWPRSEKFRPFCDTSRPASRRARVRVAHPSAAGPASGAGRRSDAPGLAGGVDRKPHFDPAQFRRIEADFELLGAALRSWRRFPPPARFMLGVSAAARPAHAGDDRRGAVLVCWPAAWLAADGRHGAGAGVAGLTPACRWRRGTCGARLRQPCLTSLAVAVFAWLALVLALLLRCCWHWRSASWPASGLAAPWAAAAGLAARLWPRLTCRRAPARHWSAAAA